MTDEFTIAARAEAEQKWPYSANPDPTPAEDEDAALNAGFMAGAEWARTYLAEQSPSEAEIEIVACTILAQTDGRDWDDIDEGERREYRRYALAVLIAGRSVNE